MSAPTWREAEMRAGSKALLILALLVGLWPAGTALAQEPAPHCNVPAYLMSTASPLEKVSEAVKSGRRLTILVVGSRSSTLANPEAAYPARLQALLREKLANVEVNVTLDLQVKKTAEDLAAGLGPTVEARKPALVIWQTGTYDAMRSVDPEDFRHAVDDGVAAIQKAGADVILMNLQYSPRTETMTNTAPYIDNMRVVAQQYDVPLFDRFAIMRQWNEDGEFDLSDPSASPDLARRVHDCLARALSALIIDAAKIDPVELRTQR
jgi:hypothetical protein